jgi:hypothetical protein
MSPDPEIYFVNHPYRCGFSSGEIRGARPGGGGGGGVGMTGIRGAGAGAGVVSNRVVKTKSMDVDPDYDPSIHSVENLNTVLMPAEANDRRPEERHDYPDGDNEGSDGGGCSGGGQRWG